MLDGLSDFEISDEEQYCIKGNEWDLSESIDKVEESQSLHVSLDKRPVGIEEHVGSDVADWNSPDKMQNELIAAFVETRGKITLDREFVEVVGNRVSLEAHQNADIEDQNVADTEKDVIVVITVRVKAWANAKVAEKSDCWQESDNQEVEQLNPLKAWHAMFAHSRCYHISDHHNHQNQRQSCKCAIGCYSFLSIAE